MSWLLASRAARLGQFESRSDEHGTEFKPCSSLRVSSWPKRPACGGRASSHGTC